MSPFLLVPSTFIVDPRIVSSRTLLVALSVGLSDSASVFEWDLLVQIEKDAPRSLIYYPISLAAHWAVYFCDLWCGAGSDVDVMERIGTTRITLFWAGRVIGTQGLGHERAESRRGEGLYDA